MQLDWCCGVSGGLLCERLFVCVPFSESWIRAFGGLLYFVCLESIGAIPIRSFDLRI